MTLEAVFSMHFRLNAVPFSISLVYLPSLAYLASKL